MFIPARCFRRTHLPASCCFWARKMCNQAQARSMLWGQPDSDAEPLPFTLPLASHSFMLTHIPCQKQQGFIYRNTPSADASTGLHVLLRYIRNGDVAWFQGPSDETLQPARTCISFTDVPLNVISSDRARRLTCVLVAGDVEISIVANNALC